MLIKKIMDTYLRGDDCMVFWVLLSQDYIGIFTDFAYLIRHYEKLKSFLHPFDDVINAYGKIKSGVEFSEQFRLRVEDLNEFPFNHFISRKEE